MNRFSQILPLLLAAALQILPLVRNLCLNPAAGSNLACYLRLGLGAAVGLESVDAVSGASSPVVFTSGPYYSGTVGAYFTNNLTISGNGNGPGDYFVLNNATVSSQLLTNGMSTTDCIPNGLTLTVHDPNNGVGVAQPIYCAIYGVPTTPVNSLWVQVSTGYQAQQPLSSAFYFTMTGSAPMITSQPAGVTNVAGAPASFSVTAGGAPAPAYQWRLASVPMPGATNHTVFLANIRAGQAGNYTVVITNSIGSVTSSIAILAVTNPNSPVLAAPEGAAGQYQFTFIPVPGLTNIVQTNHLVSAGTWGVFTNVPPPATASPVTITDTLDGSSRFYRVQVLP